MIVMSVAVKTAIIDVEVQYVSALIYLEKCVYGG